MKEGARNRVIVALGVLVVVIFSLWLGSRTELSRQKNIINVKSALNMELEEKYLRLEKERARLAQDLKEAGIRIEEEKSAQDLLKKTLSQELLAEAALKAELERLSVLKEGQEKDSLNETAKKPFTTSERGAIGG